MRVCIHYFSGIFPSNFFTQWCHSRIFICHATYHPISLHSVLPCFVKWHYYSIACMDICMFVFCPMLYHKHPFQKVNVIPLCSEESQECVTCWPELVFCTMRMKKKHTQDTRATKDKVHRQDSPAHGIFHHHLMTRLASMSNCLPLKTVCCI